MADTSTTSWKFLYETGRQALQSRKLQEAEQSFSAALQLAEDFPGGDPRLAATLNALARIYSLQRRYLAAAALLNRLLEVTERTLGPTHVQVAGVLTNLAEMYTHLGAAREELELRERVLAIRRDDSTSDTATVQRLAERVTELRAALEAQETPADDDLIEPLPVVRTAEYSAPLPATDGRDAWAPSTTPADVVPIAKPVVAERPALRVAEPPAPLVSLPPVERLTPALGPVLSVISGEHGFADMGRDEYRPVATRRKSTRSSLYSIAAGVVLIAGLLAARNYVAAPDDDERESAGSVNLANLPPATVVMPPAVAIPAAVVETSEPRTVEQLVAERRAEYKRAVTSSTLPEPTRVRERSATAEPRLPSNAAIEKALRSVDGAAAVIGERTRVATDSASALKLTAPTFNKIKMSEATLRPPDRP